MSFVNPYETKDVAASTLNNLDKQTQDLVSYLDSFFAVNPIQSKEIGFDVGDVETVKGIKITENQGAFWDEGVTYYFQPLADRLQTLSDKMQGVLDKDDTSENLKRHIQLLFNSIIDGSEYKIDGDIAQKITIAGPVDIRPTMDGTDIKNYEDLIDDSLNPTIPTLFIPTATPSTPSTASAISLDDFLKIVGTSGFDFIAKALSPATDIFDATQFNRVDVDLKELAKLLDDGDNSYNDDFTTDNPDTFFSIEAINSDSVSREFYLIGNNHAPIFGKDDTRDKRINFTHENWRYNPAPTRPKAYYDPITDIAVTGTTSPGGSFIDLSDRYKSEADVIKGMRAIAITGQEAEKVILTGRETKEEVDDAIRQANQVTMYKAEQSLLNQAKNYFLDNLSWYNAAPPRSGLTRPGFPLLTNVSSGNVSYNPTDPLYGAFTSDSSGNLMSLTLTGAGVSISNVSDINSAFGNPANADALAEYYAVSYMNASIVTSLSGEEPKFKTKNLLLHSILTTKTDTLSPFITYWTPDPNDSNNRGSDILNMSTVMAAMGTYLRGSTDFERLTDLFLENFDISSPRYVNDERTLLDLLSGKMNPNANSSVDSLLFTNMNEILAKQTEQAKHILTRGVPEALSSKLAFDIFSHMGVKKEDYGLSEVPGEPGKVFLPGYWENKRERFLPSLYYYNHNPTALPSDPFYMDKINTRLFSPPLPGATNKNGLPPDFPIMDIRDHGLFFQGLFKGVAGLLDPQNITDEPFASYPDWTDLGLPTASAAALFGVGGGPIAANPSDQNFQKLYQIYESLDKIVTDMESRITSLGSLKIPRPPTYDGLSLNSSVTGYGDQPTAKLVAKFLEKHETFSALSSTEDRVTSLINTFDGLAKFSQNDSFEKVFSSQMHESDKFNFGILNQKKLEPRPDGSFPEDNGVPKPFMAPSTTALVLTQVGQIVLSKINEVSQKANRVGSPTKITRDAAGNINLDATKTNIDSTPIEQVYIKNLLYKISDIASTRNIKMDMSALVNPVAQAMETGVRELMANTNSDNYKMAFIDETVLDEFKDIRANFEHFDIYTPNIYETLQYLPPPTIPPGPAAPLYYDTRYEPLRMLKEVIKNVNFGTLKDKLYPVAGSNAPGYLHAGAGIPSPGMDALDAAERDFVELMSSGLYKVNRVGSESRLQMLRPNPTTPPSYGPDYIDVIPKHTRAAEVRDTMLLALQDFLGHQKSYAPIPGAPLGPEPATKPANKRLIHSVTLLSEIWDNVVAAEASARNSVYTTAASYYQNWSNSLFRDSVYDYTDDQGTEDPNDDVDVYRPETDGEMYNRISAAAATYLSYVGNGYAAGTTTVSGVTVPNVTFADSASLNAKVDTITPPDTTYNNNYVSLNGGSGVMQLQEIYQDFENLKHLGTTHTNPRSPLADFGDPADPKAKVVAILKNLDIDFASLVGLDSAAKGGDNNSTSISYHAIIYAPTLSSNSTLPPSDVQIEARKKLLDGILKSAGGLDTVCNFEDGVPLVNIIDLVRGNANNIFDEVFDLPHVGTAFPGNMFAWYVDDPKLEAEGYFLAAQDYRNDVDLSSDSVSDALIPTDHLSTVLYDGVLDRSSIDIFTLDEIHTEAEGLKTAMALTTPPTATSGSSYIPAIPGLQGFPLSVNGNDVIWAGLAAALPAAPPSGASVTLSQVIDNRDSAETRRLFMRKMQAHNTLFNALTNHVEPNPGDPLVDANKANPALASFRKFIVDKGLGDQFNLVTEAAPPPTTPPAPTPTLVNFTKFIESVSKANTVTSTSAFKAITEELETLAPITDNIEALDHNLGADFRKGAVPDTDLKATLHLFTEIEGQFIETVDIDYLPKTKVKYNENEDWEEGLLQLFKTRKSAINPTPSTDLQETEKQVQGINARLWQSLNDFAVYTPNTNPNLPGTWATRRPPASAIADGPGANDPKDLTNMKDLIEEVAGPASTNDGLLGKYTPTTSGIIGHIFTTLAKPEYADNLNLEYLFNLGNQVKVKFEDLRALVPGATNQVVLNKANEAFLLLSEMMDLTRRMTDEAIPAAAGVLPDMDLKPGVSILTDEDLRHGTYKYKGYLANIDYLKPSNSPSISDGPGRMAPPSSLPTSFTDLTDVRNFLENNLLPFYEALEDSSSVEHKVQLKELDLWIQNNAVSEIAKAYLNGKEALKGDIALLDHILTNGGANINLFMRDMKDNTIKSFNQVEALNDMYSATKGFVQKITKGSSGVDLETYFNELKQAAAPGITAGPLAAVKNAWSNLTPPEAFPLAGYDEALINIDLILDKLKDAELAGGTFSTAKEVQMYRTMILSLIGETSGSLSPDFIAEVVAEATASGRSPLYPPLAYPTVPASPLESAALNYSNRFPNVSIKSELTRVKKDMDKKMDPKKVGGPAAELNLAAITRSKDLKGRSVQELSIILYVLQMFEASKWDWERYFNDSSRYEIET